jgi:hypothetical protein
MTLKAELAKSDAARAYAVASVQSDQRYWDNRRAAETAADTGRDLVVAGSPVPAADGNVVVSRPQVTPKNTTSHSNQNGANESNKPVPLAAANVAAWIADESRFDPQGVASLQREWGGDMGANLGYVKHWLHSTFTPEQREQAEAANIVSVPVIRFIAQIAREGAHAAPTTTTTPKGPTLMADESRPDALKRFRQLTSELHTARARMDHIKAREIGEARDALSLELFPGSSAPDESTSGHKVG